MKALNIPINIDAHKHLTLEAYERRECKKLNSLFKLKLKSRKNKHTPLLMFIEGLKIFAE